MAEQNITKALKNELLTKGFKTHRDWWIPQPLRESINFIDFLDMARLVVPVFEWGVLHNFAQNIPEVGMDLIEYSSGPVDLQVEQMKQSPVEGQAFWIRYIRDEEAKRLLQQKPNYWTILSFPGGLPALPASNNLVNLPESLTKRISPYKKILLKDNQEISMENID